MGPLRAENPVPQPPPGRQVSTPLPSPTPEVRAEELKRLRESTEQAQALLERRIHDIDQRVSGAARVKDDDLRALRASLDQASESLRGFELRLGALERGQKEQGEGLQLARKDLVELSAALQTAREELGAARKKVDANQVELKARADKLEDLVDLLGALRRDLNANNEEIVDLRRQIGALDGKSQPQGSNGQWWDEALRWPYMPVVATGLAAIALGVAASK